MRLLPAETSSFPSPIPTQFVASDEFTPVPQTEQQKKKHGFAALGPADGPVKRAILGENSARLYKYDAKRRAELMTDRVALAKTDYEREGPGRTNLRYGYVV